jgi:hypothetical protein
MPSRPEQSAALASRSHPVQEDMAFQRATWRVERIGWGVLCALVALALLGAFSNGPLSAATRTDADGRLRVDFERLQRNGATSTLRVRVEPATGPVTLRLRGSLARDFEVETVTPHPLVSAGRPDGVDLTFESPAAEPFEIRFTTRAGTIGIARSTVAIAGAPAVPLTQFVFP